MSIFSRASSLRVDDVGAVPRRVDAVAPRVGGLCAIDAAPAPGAYEDDGAFASTLETRMCLCVAISRGRRRP